MMSDQLIEILTILCRDRPRPVEMHHPDRATLTMSDIKSVWVGASGVVYLSTEQPHVSATRERS